MRGSGRILWINTPAILPIPYVSSIHAPDFAVNCIIRTLRKEIGLSIPVVMIRCGMINTASPAKGDRELEKNLQSWPEDKLKYYSNALQKVKKSFSEGDKNRTDPEEVAKIIEIALSVKRPLKKYRVGHLSLLSDMLEYLPQGIIDRIMPDYR
jgi:NAD(P)-dependent dehydrogenase (short-subunit alcohol dehydrogenase family)